MTTREDTTMASIQKRDRIPEEERKPFEKIAKAKDKQIQFGTNEQGFVESSKQFHLDMDMVDASLLNAIMQTERNEQFAIRVKLERLLENGTDVEKVEFVLGSGSYYFPEDIQAMADESRDKAFTPDSVLECEFVCWVVCTCLTQESQECAERCRNICKRVHR